MIINQSQIETYLPADSLEHVRAELSKIKVSLKIEIKPQRKTRYGDYRRYPDGSHKITVNNNLNPQEFLLTLLHELAHLITFLRNGVKVKPHGKEWKLNYKLLMLPMINDKIFNAETLPLIAKHFKSPKASIDSDYQLAFLLRGNKRNQNKTCVFQLDDGAVFTVDKKRTFVKEGKKTKKMVCKDLDTGKRYLFHPNVEVELVK